MLQPIILTEPEIDRGFCRKFYSEVAKTEGGKEVLADNLHDPDVLTVMIKLARNSHDDYRLVAMSAQHRFAEGVQTIYNAPDDKSPVNGHIAVSERMFYEASETFRHLLGIDNRQLSNTLSTLTPSRVQDMNKHIANLSSRAKSAFISWLTAASICEGLERLLECLGCSYHNPTKNEAAGVLQKYYAKFIEGTYFHEAYIELVNAFK